MKWKNYGKSEIVENGKMLSNDDNIKWNIEDGRLRKC